MSRRLIARGIIADDALRFDDLDPGHPDWLAAEAVQAHGLSTNVDHAGPFPARYQSAEGEALMAEVLGLPAPLGHLAGALGLMTEDRDGQPVPTCGSESDPVESLDGATVKCTKPAGHVLIEGHAHVNPSEPDGPALTWFYDAPVPVHGLAIVDREVRALIEAHGLVAVAIAFYQATTLDLLQPPPSEGT